MRSMKLIKKVLYSYYWWALVKVMCVCVFFKVNTTRKVLRTVKPTMYQQVFFLFVSIKTVENMENVGKRNII